jgi:3-(3-hydroxy-phenyl)propionate hydroxylase
MKRAKVIVIGAGPVGVVAAYRLALAGVDVALLEAENACAADMRASTLHPPTLAMLEALGVREALEAQGLRAPVYHYRNRRTGDVIAFDLGEIGDLTPYPYRLQCEQFKVTRLLTRLIAEHANGQVAFSRKLLGFEQDASGVTLKVEAPLEIETWRADYLIGADGANSIVRKWLETPFDGFTYPEKFLTLSTEFPIEERMPGIAYVNYVADPDEWCVVLRVPQFWRVLVPVKDDAPDELITGDGYKTDIFSRLVGPEIAATLQTEHRTIYRVHQRVAREYRRGRVVMVGDAAHLNNPLGGFGLNSGVHDAWNLTGKLLEVFAGGDADALLGRYERQRRTVMQEFVQTQTIRNKQALESGAGGDRSEMELELAHIQADPDLRRAYLKKQGMLASLEREAEIQ